jgi:hypothetical protein
MTTIIGHQRRYSGQAARHEEAADSCYPLHCPGNFLSSFFYIIEKLSVVENSGCKEAWNVKGVKRWNKTDEIVAKAKKEEDAVQRRIDGSFECTFEAK